MIDWLHIHSPQVLAPKSKLENENENSNNSILKGDLTSHENLSNSRKKEMCWK
jgi:hypothetical protein